MRVFGGRVKERAQPLRSHQPRSDDHFPPTKTLAAELPCVARAARGVVCTGTRSPSPPTPGSRRVWMVKVSGARRSGEAGCIKTWWNCLRTGSVCPVLATGSADRASGELPLPAAIHATSQSDRASSLEGGGQAACSHSKLFRKCRRDPLISE